MKSTHRKCSVARAPAGLRTRLAEAEETLRAIRAGEVDAMMGAGKRGAHVFSLDGAAHAYRVLIESMNEGALTLAMDQTILYANQCFARMVRCPLEQIIGSSLGRFLSADDRATLHPLLQRAGSAGSKIHAQLKADDGSQLAVQISLRALSKKGSPNATAGMVVTDLTESRRTEELLRALSRRLVQVQEAERGRVALELDNHITQLLCGILIRSQTLADTLPPDNGPARREARKLHKLLGHAAEETERISRNLRPGVLKQLGLIAVLRDTGSVFAKQTGMAFELVCPPMPARLPEDIELTLYRILQEALSNVQAHASARQVTVRLARTDSSVQLMIIDDGMGFVPNPRPALRHGKGALGLLSMRERAAYLGGILTVKSTRRAGTEIEVRIPVLASV